MHLYVEALKDSYVGTQVWAARVLGRLGPQAALAVPALLEMLASRSRRRRMAAAWALQRIAPRTLQDSRQQHDHRPGAVPGPARGSNELSARRLVASR